LVNINLPGNPPPARALKTRQIRPGFGTFNHRAEKAAH